MTIDGNFFTFLTIGQVFSRVFSIFVDRLDIFLTISVLVHLPAIVLTVIVVLALAPVGTDATASHMEFISNHMGSVMAIAYLQILLSMLATIAGEGGIVRATADIYVGRTPDWYGSLRTGLNKFFPLAGGSLLVMLGFGAVLVVASILFMLFMSGSSTNLGFLFILMAVIVAAIGFVTVVAIYVTVIPLYSIIVIEEKGPMNALRRCMEITKGRQAYMLVGALILLGAQKILARLLHKIFNPSDDPASFFFSPSGTLISFIPNILYLPLATILHTVLYMSVRVDKEGLNQQVLQRELSDPVEYHPPVSDYRQVSLVDDRQQPNIVPTMSDDEFA